MDPVSGDAEHGLGGGAEVPDAAVPRLALQSLGGAVPRQAVQAIGAAVPGLRRVVEARHASVGQPVVYGPEAGGCVPGSHGISIRTPPLYVTQNRRNPQNSPAVSGAVQAAVVAAHLGAGAAHRAGAAGAGAGRLIQHGQVSGRGVRGRPLGGRAPRLPHNGRVGVPE